MNIRLLSALLLGSISLLVLGTTTSCTKDPETIIKTDTLTVTVNVPVKSIDTVFKMNALSWRGYSFTTSAKVDSGGTTFFTTSEGVKALGQSYRHGIRLQTVGEVGFVNKTIYFKWKGSGNGQFTDFIPQIKYDPTTNDGIPPIQGVDLDYFHVNGSAPGPYSTGVTESTWYYTRIASVAGSDNYTVTTATGNYSNQGGTVISTKTVPIYTKNGFIGFRTGDAYGGSGAYFVLGECKIASN
jgi:hypothetical protein